MPTTNKDKVFSTKLETIAPFEFNEGVASVFDDMVARSIPVSYTHLTLPTIYSV